MRHLRSGSSTRLCCSFLALVLVLACTTDPRVGQTSPVPDSPREPNIVLIVADDAGYGDFSVYGQRRFATPNIDRLASEGIRFTQFYAGSTVCAPSRSVLMTGQHTGHTFIRGNPSQVDSAYALPPGTDYPLPDSVVTLPELLQQAGYVTGAFGKWGLGYPGSEGDPNNQGIDHFFGYLSHRAAHHYYPEYLWANDRKVSLSGNENAGLRTYSHDVIQERALAFLEENQDRPFFLYLPYTIPHAELLVPDDSILARFEERYGEAPLPAAETSLEDYGGPYAIPERPRAARAAMMTRMDRSVGEVLAKLEELGIDNNTLVLFSSDNGPSSEARSDLEFFDSNGPFRGKKRDLYEGGIRVPLLARWPGRIAPGRVSEHVAAFWDVLPTLTELAGAATPPGIDGISFVPTLLNRGEQAEHEYLYWEFSERGGKQAIRLGDWKGVRLGVIEQPHAPIELYDLSSDPAEEHDIADQHPEIVRRITEIMQSARTDSDVWPALNEPIQAGPGISGAP